MLEVPGYVLPTSTLVFVFGVPRSPDDEVEAVVSESVALPLEELVDGSPESVVDELSSAFDEESISMLLFDVSGEVRLWIDSVGCGTVVVIVFPPASVVVTFPPGLPLKTTL